MSMPSSCPHGRRLFSAVFLLATLLGDASAETLEPTPDAAQARTLVVPRVEVRDLNSQINGIHYELRVSLPEGYESGKQSYPVVVTLDADYSFLIARNITDHLSQRNDLPKVIVVGIAYGGDLQYRTHRTRDYTPTFVPQGGYGPEIQKVSGGAPEFREVLEKEILPLVAKHYRTAAKERTLVGHSYGGLFASWTLLTRPGLFDNFVIVSPSLWYDHHLVARLEAKFAAAHSSLPAEVYLCVGSREGNGDTDMVGDLRRFTTSLHSRLYTDFALQSLIMENETHNSIFPGCLSNGLRFVLDGV